MPYPNALNPNPSRNALANVRMLQRPEEPYMRQQFPGTYGFLGGLMGTAPDEMQGSVLDPNTATVRQGASYGYLPGLIASNVPIGKAGAGLGMLAGMARGVSKTDEALAAIQSAKRFNNAALTGGKAVAKIDEITGLPLNPDGTVTLFHHTNKNAAQSIKKTGVLKSAGEPSVYLTTERTPTTGYGDTVVPVKVNPSKLNLDDEFPGGRLDFSIDVGKPGGSVKVTPTSSFVYPQDEALRLAQQRASLPPAQGGLGLSTGNTPEQRASAMGFNINNPMYHATDVDFPNIRPSAQGKMGAGVYVSPSSKYAEKYTSLNAAGNARVLPLVSRGQLADENVAMNVAESIRKKMFAENPNFNVLDWKRKTTQALSDAGYSGREMNGLESVITDPNNIRSRFAAFDPFRKTAAIAAAAGLAAPDLLAAQPPVQQFGQQPAQYSVQPSRFNNSALK